MYNILEFNGKATFFETRNAWESIENTVEQAERKGNIKAKKDVKPKNILSGHNATAAATTPVEQIVRVQIVKLRPEGRDVPSVFGNATSPFGNFSTFINPTPTRSYTDAFDVIIKNLATHNDKVNLMRTSTAMYNFLNCDVIRWSGSEFCFAEFYLDGDGKKRNYQSAMSPDGCQKLVERTEWKIQIVGPNLGYIENDTEARSAEAECKHETAKVLFFLERFGDLQLDSSASIMKTRISEIEFSHMDMLSPETIVGSRLRPFNLKKVHFNHCREFTMQQVAEKFGSFMATSGFPQVTYNCGLSVLPELRQENASGGIVASLYSWRRFQPFLLTENLIKNKIFRKFIQTVTGSGADEWYAFVYRQQGDDNAADQKLLEKQYGGELVKGSKALMSQEPCRDCEIVMPGLYYPINRRNTGEQEQGHACRIHEKLFWRVPDSQLEPWAIFHWRMTEPYLPRRLGASFVRHPTKNISIREGTTQHYFASNTVRPRKIHTMKRMQTPLPSAYSPRESSPSSNTYPTSAVVRVNEANTLQME